MQCSQPNGILINGRCFWQNTITGGLNFSQAQYFCSVSGGNLPSLHSANEVRQLISLTSGAPLWIGLIQSSNSSNLTWSDGSSLDD